MTTFLVRPANGVQPLPAWGGHKKAAHVFDDDSVFAINAALATGRPLLVRGDPGMGKSQLARAAAVALKRAFLHHTVDARSEPRDLLWCLDAVARLAEAQVLGALGKTLDEDSLRKAMALDNFITPGVLWWAFDWASATAQAEKARHRAPERPEGVVDDAGCVVLVDEIDKADGSVPNALLDALGHGRFEVPGCATLVEMKRARRPLVVVTTNEERALPDAFLRRCFVLRLGLSSDPTALRQQLVTRGQAHFGNQHDALLQQAAELIAKRREERRNDGAPAPGVAEYIDLVEAVLEQPASGLTPDKLMEKLAGFVLHKHDVETQP